MRSKTISFLTLVLFFFCMMPPGRSQTSPLSTRSKKAAAFFTEAINYYDQKDYDKAIRILDRAIHEDSVFVEAFILKGDIISEQQDPRGAIVQYKKGIKANPDFSPTLYYILANVELMTGLYTDARADYEKFLSYPGQAKDKQDKANRNIKSCDFGINSMAHPVPFKPVNLGDSINSKYDDYMNAVTADEQELFLTRKLPRAHHAATESTEFNEDFYKAKKVDSVWRKAVNMGSPVNTEENEGALCISPDGKYIFFAACDRPDGYGSCDLYWSKKTGDSWGTPENMGPVVNSSAWDSQPSFSSDGKTLYFASSREGGKGRSDIWKTELKPDGSWTAPVNLGDSINTKAEEMAPFIHPDNHTLYFASRGHQGMGGFDLFVSRMDADGNWSSPVDLAYPINTYADEINLVVNAKGDVAYISSDKLGGKGGMDIYSFKLYKEAQPKRRTACQPDLNLSTWQRGKRFPVPLQIRLRVSFFSLCLLKRTMG